jgi:hypothetical protein
MRQPFVVSVAFDAEAQSMCLQDAVRRRDRELLETLVSDRFALVSGRALGRIGKDEWIAAALRVHWKSFRVSINRVIDAGDVAIVDHDIEQEMVRAPSWAPQASLRTRWVTTDAWIREAGGWRLICRHPELVQ